MHAKDQGTFQSEVIDVSVFPPASTAPSSFDSVHDYIGFRIKHIKGKKKILSAAVGFLTDEIGDFSIDDILLCLEESGHRMERVEEYLDLMLDENEIIRVASDRFKALR